MSELELDPLLLMTMGALERHNVQFVLVGDVADAIYNNGGFVSGVAIVPASYGRNVERLITALEALNAEMGIAGTPASEVVDWRRSDLRDLAPCSFITSGAEVDIDFEPAGTRGYQDLFDDASQIQLAPGVAPLVASPSDLERVRRGTAAPTPFAQPPLVLPPEPEPEPDDLAYVPPPAPGRPEPGQDIPYAQIPPSLPPEPDDGDYPGDEIRASRQSHSRY